MKVLTSSYALFCVVLLGSTNTQLMAGTADIVVKGDSRIEVVYISALDCPSCKSWRYTRAGDWARFSETETGRAITLVTVDKGSIRNFMKREFYPKEYAALYDKSNRFGDNIPAWWVLVDGAPVIRRVGEDKWKSGIEPALEKLVDAKRQNGGIVSGLSVVPAKPAFVPTDISDVEHVPYLSEKAKDSYRNFLSTSRPRAFALSPDGTFWWWHGGTEPRKKALDGCNANSTDFPCRLYVVDNQIVWHED